MKVKVDKFKQPFIYSYDNEIWMNAGIIDDAAYLSDQDTANLGFMGMMSGVFAFNRRTGKGIAADFDWCRITGR